MKFIRMKEITKSKILFFPQVVQTAIDQILFKEHLEFSNFQGDLLKKIVSVMYNIVF